MWRIPTSPRSWINSFAFEETTGELTLVDAGVRGAHTKILRALVELGKRPKDVTRLVLTHAHFDHAGGLARIERATGARLAAHEADTSFVERGARPPADRASPLGRVLARLPGSGWKPWHVDERLSDGAVLDVGGGLRVVHTPGHTPGHISLLHERSGVLITGDALFNFREIAYGWRSSCTDIRLSRETAARLGELDFEIAAFTHGREIREHARARIREFLKARSE